MRYFLYSVYNQQFTFSVILTINMLFSLSVTWMYKHIEQKQTTRYLFAKKVFFFPRSNFFNSINLQNTYKISRRRKGKKNSSSWPGRSKLWKIFSKSTWNFPGGTKYHKNMSKFPGGFSRRDKILLYYKTGRIFQG